MPGKLTRKQRARLEDLVQYLNLEELRGFCSSHDLPLHICVERNGPTVYPLAVVAEGSLPSPLTARTRIHYGQCEKHNPAFVAKLVELTGGTYRNGMISRLVLRDFWTEGVAPTMKAFADAWLEATAAHTEPRPEGAYLVDLARGTAGPDWKQKRRDHAAEALAWLAQLVGARA